MMPAVTVSLLVLASLMLGFLRDGLVAYFFGADWHADLYFLALLIPIFIENSLAVGVRDTLVAAFIREREGASGEYRQLAGQTGALVLAAAAIFVVLFYISGSFWVDRFGGVWMKGHGQSVALAYDIGILMVATTLWSYYQTSLLHAERSFVWPAWRSVVFNIGGIVFLGLVWRSIEGLLLGLLVGQIAHIVVLQVKIGPAGLTMPLREDAARWKGLLPGFLVMVSVALFLQLGVGTERLLASWTGIGELSRLSYSFRIASVPVTLFAFSVVGICYARFSRLAVDGVPAQMNGALVDAQRGSLFLLVPVAVLIYGYSDTVLDILLHRGAFHAGDVQRTAELMRIYAIGMPAAGLSLVIMRFFAAIREYRRLMVSVSSVQVVICIAYVAVYRNGVMALALVTTIGAIVQALLLWMSLPRAMRALMGAAEWGALALIIAAMAGLMRAAGNGLVGLVVGGAAAIVLPLAVTTAIGIRSDVVGSMVRMLGRHD